MRFTAAVTLLLMTIAATPVEAQWEDEKTVWRIHGGVNSSSLAGSDADRGDLHRRQGVILGVSSLVRLTTHFGVELGALYSQKGAEGRVEETDEFEIPFVSGSIEGTARLHYIEIPLMMNVTIPFSARFATRWYAGPAMALLSSAVLERESGAGAPPTRTESVDIARWTQNLDVAAVVGAAAVFDAGPGNLTLGLRWARGFRTLDDTDLSLEVYNSSLSVLVGVEFPRFGERGGGHGVFQ